MLRYIINRVREAVSSLHARFIKHHATKVIEHELRLAHAQELAATPGNEWGIIRDRQAKEIAAVRDGNVTVVDRRSWQWPYLPSSMSRIRQPIVKAVPYNIRRFMKSPVPRRALNQIKNAVTSLDWDIVPMEGTAEAAPEELLERIKSTKRCFEKPNLQESYQSFMDIGIDDMLTFGAFVCEPQITPDPKRPIKMWNVDSSCVTDDTEVLTKRGWVFWPNVREDDVFATQDRKGNFEWQEAIELHKKFFDGQMIRFRRHDRDIIVTPNHRMYGRKVKKIWRIGKKKSGVSQDTCAYGNFEFVPAEQLIEDRREGDIYDFDIPLTSTWKGTLPSKKFKLIPSPLDVDLKHTKHTKSVSIDWKDWAAFLGIWVAEGSTFGTLQGAKKKQKDHPDKFLYACALDAQKDGTASEEQLNYILNSPNNREFRKVTITQSWDSNRDNCRKIESLLQRLPFEYRKYGNNFVIVDPVLWSHLRQFGNKYTKRVPEYIKEATPEVIEEFVDWAVLGDGCRRGDVWDYITCSEQLANDMQELAQKLGKSASVGGGKDSSYSMDLPRSNGEIYVKAPVYNVHLQNKEYVRLKAPKAKEYRYKGYVYCASVPNETLYMRRKGQPFWIGNTIRIYPTWRESDEDEPHYAQMTGLRGERGIIVFYDDELMYLRDNPTVETPFGLGRGEIAFQAVNALLGVQEMAGRAGADQTHRTWLWWEGAPVQNQVEVIRRHLTNDLEGQAKVNIQTGMKAPTVIDIQPTAIDDLLLPWQEMLIRMIANAFDLSPMALGIERDVNRSTGEVMDDKDFRSAVVPLATKLADGFTRFILHRKLRWTDIKFVFTNLDDPDALTKMTIQSQAYQSSAQTPNGMRVAMGMEKLATPWADLTMIEAVIAQTIVQAQLAEQSAQSNFGRQQETQQQMLEQYNEDGEKGEDEGGEDGESGGRFVSSGIRAGIKIPSIKAPKPPGLKGPMSVKPPSIKPPMTPKIAGSVYSGKQLASMTPKMLKAAVASGLAPANATDIKQKIGDDLLLTVSQELKQYLDTLEKEQDKSRRKSDPKVSKEDKEKQEKLFQKSQHKQTLIERTVYNVDKDGLPKTRKGQKPITPGSGLGKETPNFLSDDRLSRKRPSRMRKSRRDNKGEGQ